MSSVEDSCWELFKDDETRLMVEIILAHGGIDQKSIISLLKQALSDQNKGKPETITDEKISRLLKPLKNSKLVKSERDRNTKKCWINQKKYDKCLEQLNEYLTKQKEDNFTKNILNKDMFTKLTDQKTSDKILKRKL